MFSSWLEKTRRTLGLTQQELGELTGVSGNTVGMWERGRRVPGPRAAARLRAFFGKRGMEMPPPPRRPEPPERERFRAEILQAMGKGRQR